MGLLVGLGVVPWTFRPPCAFSAPDGAINVPIASRLPFAMRRRIYFVYCCVAADPRPGCFLAPYLPALRPFFSLFTLSSFLGPGWQPYDSRYYTHHAIRDQGSG